MAVAALALLAGCGGGGGKSSSSAAAKAQIRQNWEAFFDGSTPTDKRISLLQNGQSFAKLLQTVGASPLAAQVKAKVGDVALQGADKATVTYTVMLGGQAVLKNAKGTAVRENGTWKVGTSSFCQLVRLQGAAPAACVSK